MKSSLLLLLPALSMGCGTPASEGPTGVDVPAAEAGASVDGSRLQFRTRVTTGSDGSVERTPVVWDSELGTECSWVRQGDGVVRCEPPVIARMGFYSDDQCSEPLAQVQTPPSCWATPSIALSPLPACQKDAYVRVTSKHEGAVFTGTPDSCTEREVSASTYWKVGEPVELVEASTDYE